jgi:hypothetical protein
MTTGTNVQREISTPEPLDPPSPGVWLTGDQASADHSRATQKVAAWRQYLPSDCEGCAGAETEFNARIPRSDVTIPS